MVSEIPLPHKFVKLLFSITCFNNKLTFWGGVDFLKPFARRMRAFVLGVGCGLWLGVWGFGFGAWGLKFGVWGLGFGVWGLEFGVWGLRFGVWVVSCWLWVVEGGLWAVCCVLCVVGFGVWGLWVRAGDSVHVHMCFKFGVSGFGGSGSGCTCAE